MINYDNRKIKDIIFDIYGLDKLKGTREELCEEIFNILEIHQYEYECDFWVDEDFLYIMFKKELDILDFVIFYCYNSYEQNRKLWRIVNEEDKVDLYKTLAEYSFIKDRIIEKLLMEE